MNDLISRSELIEALKEDKKSLFSQVFCYVAPEMQFDVMNNLERLINNQPTVEPVREWIPVSEELPEGCKDAEIEVLVTINEEYIEASFNETVPALYYPETKTFHSVYNNRTDITNIVIAWMPLPEAYRKDVE